MKRTFPIIFVIAGILCSVVLIAGCVSPTTPPQTATPTPSPTATPVAYSVMTANNARYGTILVDGNGMTLYYSTHDVPGNGSSWCYDTCAANWPPLSVSQFLVALPLNAADFGTIARTDGVNQITYQGWPLYYFHTDTAPGDTNGYGLLGSWFVISPAGIVTITSTPTPPSVATTLPTTQTTTIPTTTYSSSY
jgi:predicted lipoprotein with Yx(FWY)xxD motif